MRNKVVFQRNEFVRTAFMIALALSLFCWFLPANAQSTSIAGGTLSWTETTTSGKCGPATPPPYTFTEWTDGSFKFVYGGTTYSLSNSATYIQDNNSTTGCPPDGATQSPVSLSVPAGSDAGCTILFYISSGGGGSTTLQCPSTLIPAYKVTSIIYAPPGNKSSSGYGDTTTNGTTTTVGSSFSEGNSVTFTEGFSAFGLGSTATETFGVSTSSGNSHAFTETYTDATGVSLQSNSANPNAINHAQDLFLIWLNPQINVTLNGSVPENYAILNQPSTSGVNAGSDIVEVTAAAMQANSSGHSQVPLSILELQSLPSGSGGTQVTLPGLASICANKTYYPNACSNDPNGQCGCVPSDFAPILALDPLLGSAGTVSPLSVDASGATVCANPTASSNCRYVPVPSAKGSTVQQVQILSGPDTVGGDSVCNSFTQTDSTTTTETLSGSTGQTVGASFKTGTPVFSLSDANTITWTDTQSTGTTSGSGNSQSMNLCSATVACNEDVAVYEDTIFHTFVFQQPSGNNSCP